MCNIIYIYIYIYIYMTSAERSAAWVDECLGAGQDRGKRSGHLPTRSYLSNYQYLIIMIGKEHTHKFSGNYKNDKNKQL